MLSRKSHWCHHVAHSIKNTRSKTTSTGPYVYIVFRLLCTEGVPGVIMYVDDDEMELPTIAFICNPVRGSSVSGA